MKKIIYTISTITVATFISCGGGGNSKEAKELLQKILYLVGIPQEIVVNICQNDNRNSVCEGFELQAKITIDRKDTIDSILSKIEATGDGRYLLETYDPTKPLLLELQDRAIVKYDNGKFFLHFNGLSKDEKEKELSIFESAIDAKYLTAQNVKNIRNLKYQETQDRFYQMLLKVFEENLNTLRDRLAQPKVSPESSTLSKDGSYNILAEQAIRDNLIEISQLLIKNGVESELPNRLNGCSSNLECVDNILNEIYKKIKITPQRAEEIYPIIDTNTTYTGVPDNAFITIWKTANRGVSKDNQIMILTEGDGYNYGVDWGDGTYDLNLTGDITHTYSAKGEYRVSIFGKFPKIAFGKGSDGNLETVENDARKVISIEKWGDIKLNSLEKSFMECSSLESEATDKPNLSNVKSAKYAFYGATSFNGDLSSWDISNITDTSYMFAYAYTFNQNISSWNVANVTNMDGMFKEAKSFNQDISSWRVGKVRSMKEMFVGVKLTTENYDSLLNGWAEQILTAGVQFNAGDSIYSCDGKDARDKLTNIWDWVIFDGGTSCDKEEYDYTGRP